LLATAVRTVVEILRFAQDDTTSEGAEFEDERRGLHDRQRLASNGIELFAGALTRCVGTHRPFGKAQGRLSLPEGKAKILVPLAWGYWVFLCIIRRTLT